MFTHISLFTIILGTVAAIALPISPLIPGPILRPAEVEAPARYDFSYSVRDDHTGDIKSQTESRKDDQVQGQYSLIDADGLLRTVDYTSDAHNGFIAVVRREPLGQRDLRSPQLSINKIVSPLSLSIGARV